MKCIFKKYDECDGIKIAYLPEKFMEDENFRKELFGYLKERIKNVSKVQKIDLVRNGYMVEDNHLIITLCGFRQTVQGGTYLVENERGVIVSMDITTLLGTYPLLGWEGNQSCNQNNTTRSQSLSRQCSTVPDQLTFTISLHG